MVEITMIELHIEEGSIAANLPFSGVDSSEEADDGGDRDEREDAGISSHEESDGGSKKKLAVLGVFVFLVIAAALVKYLSGDDEPDVEIETPDEPVGVAVDTDDD